MPGIGGVGANLINGTVESKNLLSSAGALALSFASAFGQIELSRYAQGQGSFVIATGNKDNPVSVIPGTQVQLQNQQTILAQQKQTSVIVVGIGALLATLVVFASFRTARRTGG
jgi:hypothetical protein